MTIMANFCLTILYMFKHLCYDLFDVLKDCEFFISRSRPSRFSPCAASAPRDGRCRRSLRPVRPSAFQRPSVESFYDLNLSSFLSFCDVFLFCVYSVRFDFLRSLAFLEVYDFIIFRGQDIKDLTVLEGQGKASSVPLLHRLQSNQKERTGQLKLCASSFF